MSAHVWHRYTHTLREGCSVPAYTSPFSAVTCAYCSGKFRLAFLCGDTHTHTHTNKHTQTHTDTHNCAFGEHWKSCMSAKPWSSQALYTHTHTPALDDKGGCIVCAGGPLFGIIAGQIDLFGCVDLLGKIHMRPPLPRALLLGDAFVAALTALATSVHGPAHNEQTSTNTHISESVSGTRMAPRVTPLGSLALLPVIARSILHSQSVKVTVTVDAESGKPDLTGTPARKEPSCRQRTSAASPQ